MTHPAGPPPFRPAGFRAEPIDPSKYNVEQEFERGREAGLREARNAPAQWVVGNVNIVECSSCATAKRDALRELADSDEWFGWRMKMSELRLAGLITDDEWLALVKRVEAGA